MVKPNMLCPPQPMPTNTNKFRNINSFDATLQQKRDEAVGRIMKMESTRIDLVSPEPKQNGKIMNGKLQNGSNSNLTIEISEDSNSVMVVEQKSSPDIEDNTPIDIPEEIFCTACNKNIKWKKKKVCKHPRLGAILCKSCLKFINSNDFATDEQGIEEFCTWCGDGGNLVCCDFCEKAFCKHCVKRNLGKPFLKTLLAATDDVKWKCFCCDHNQIAMLISQCSIVMDHVEKLRSDDSTFDVDKTHIHGISKKERLERITEISETVTKMPETHVTMKSSFDIKKEITNEAVKINEQNKDENKEKTGEKEPINTVMKEEKPDKKKNPPARREKKKTVTVVLSSSDDSDEEIVLISKSGKKTVLNKSILMAAQELLNKKNKPDKAKKSQSKPTAEEKNPKKGLSSFMRLKLEAKSNNSEDDARSDSDSDSPPERESSNSDSSDDETLHSKKQKSKDIKREPEIIDGVVVDGEQPGPSGVKRKMKKNKKKNKRNLSDSTDDDDFIPNLDALQEKRKEEAKKIMTDKMLGSDDGLEKVVKSPKAKRITLTSERAGLESLNFEGNEGQKKKDLKGDDVIDEEKDATVKSDKIDKSTEEVLENEEKVIPEKKHSDSENDDAANDEKSDLETQVDEIPQENNEPLEEEGKDTDINTDSQDCTTLSDMASPPKLTELSKAKLDCSVNIKKLDINIKDSSEDSSKGSSHKLNTSENALESSNENSEESPGENAEQAPDETTEGAPNENSDEALDENTEDIPNDDAEELPDDENANKPTDDNGEKAPSDNEDDKDDDKDDEEENNDAEDEEYDSDDESEKESKTLRRSKRKRNTQDDSSNSSDNQAVRTPKSKKKRRRTKKQVVDDDSDAELVIKKSRKKISVKSSGGSDSETSSKQSKTKRIKKDSESMEQISSDSDSSDSVVERKTISSDSAESSDASIIITRKKKNEKGGKKKGKGRKKKDAVEIDDDDDDDSDTNRTPSKGRRKIRKIMKDNQLTEETRHARELEEQRRQRLLQRTAKEREEYRKILEVCDGEYVIETNEKKEPLVAVSADINVHLKPHQRKGVKFMYDCCIESVTSYRKGEGGGGCLLAHCMGLGKTLQIVTFCHTLTFNENIKMEKFLIVAPLNTVLNWEQEFQKWLKVEERIDVYVLSNCTNGNKERMQMIREWHKNGGALITGYEMYRNLVNYTFIRSKKMKEDIKRCLVDPGPQLVVCDEGHVLRNSTSGISIAMNGIKTRRRIVLTGTPLQNNLPEYHVMVDFIKPNLLGTKKEFQNRFVNPINNGRCSNSTPRDVRVMKQRCHILYQLLSGCVQRQDYSVLTPFLPSKREYTIFVRLTDKQKEIYEHYLENFVYQGPMQKLKGNSLFSDFHCLSCIWSHPWSLHLERLRRIARERYKDDDSIEEFLDDDDDDDEGEAESSNSDGGKAKPWTVDTSSDEDDNKRRKRRKQFDSSDSEDSSESEKEEATPPPPPLTTGSRRNTRTARAAAAKEYEPRDSEKFKDETLNPTDAEEEEKQEFNDWYDEFLKPEDESDVELSGKLVIMLEVIANAEVVGDKVLVFTQSLASLDLIESALGGGSIGGNQLNWCHGIDYYRMDGSTNVQKRKRWSDSFNDPDNEKCRLFLISTKAGSLGINMVAANRVIIFDCSWNPSHDVQSVFRVFRFGQEKPCYVYRLVAQGTMEEKVYDRQITKLAVASRVVDEMQIERHFTDEEIRELYTFTPEKIPENPETPQLPKDPLLAEVLQRQHPKYIVRYHEHDLLLANVQDEEMNEDEKQLAWKSYEDEKNMATRTFQYRVQSQSQPDMANANFQQMLNQQQDQVNGRLQIMNDYLRSIGKPPVTGQQVRFSIVPSQNQNVSSRSTLEQRRHEIERLTMKYGADNLAGQTIMVPAASASSGAHNYSVYGATNNQVHQQHNQQYSQQYNQQQMGLVTPRMPTSVRLVRTAQSTPQLQQQARHYTLLPKTRFTTDAQQKMNK